MIFPKFCLIQSTLENTFVDLYVKKANYNDTPEAEKLIRFFFKQ